MSTKIEAELSKEIISLVEKKFSNEIEGLMTLVKIMPTILAGALPPKLSSSLLDLTLKAFCLKVKTDYERIQKIKNKKDCDCKICSSKINEDDIKYAVNNYPPILKEKDFEDGLPKEEILDEMADILTKSLQEKTDPKLAITAYYDKRLKQFKL